MAGANAQVKVVGAVFMASYRHIQQQKTGFCAIVVGRFEQRVIVRGLPRVFVAASHPIKGGAAAVQRHQAERRVVDRLNELSDQIRRQLWRRRQHRVEAALELSLWK